MLARAVVGIALLVHVAVAAAPKPVPPPQKLRNTYYFIVDEKEFAKLPVTSQLLDLKGGTLARVSAEFKRRVDTEGTGRLADGRLVNFAGRVNGEIRYAVVKVPFGYGVGRCELIPFHTVAVDPQRVPLGSVVRIDETVGMVLGSGEKHNGLWRVEDIGSAIQGDRVDLFVGDGDQGPILERKGIHNLDPLTVTVVEMPPEKSCVQEERPNDERLDRG